MALEAVGKIGGPEAHRALKERVLAAPSATVRFALKGLAHWATAEDSTFFRQSLTSTDWMVRLASAEALSKFPTQENLMALADLAADPVSVVGQKVQSILEGAGEWFYAEDTDDVR